MKQTANIQQDNFKQQRACALSSESPAHVRVASVPSKESPVCPTLSRFPEKWEGEISTDEKSLRRFVTLYNAGVREFWARITGWDIKPNEVHFVNGKNRVMVIIARS